MAATPTTTVEHLLVHTAQHYDIRMSEAFFRDLDIPQPGSFTAGTVVVDFSASAFEDSTGQGNQALAAVMRQVCSIVRIGRRIASG